MTAAATADRVLQRLLSHREQEPDGSVSGQQIADDLGLSRNAVWKAVAALREAGYVIDAEPRAGYRLVSAPDPIQPDLVLSRLQFPFYKSIQYLSETDSTQNVAKQLAKSGAPEGTVVAADRQLQGRGRRGRTWDAAPGQSLLVSIVLRPDIPPRKVPIIVFLASVAVRSALAPYGQTWIKWPNDVVTEDNRKLCGILVELDAEHDRVRHCIVGIGLNVGQRPQDFPAPVRSTATSVAELAGAPVKRTALLAGLLDEFAREYEMLLADGGRRVLAEIRRHSAVIGRRVVVHEANGSVWSGTAVDVQDDGALLVRPQGNPDGAPRGWPVAGGQHANRDLVGVYAADVSIRTKEETTIERL